MQYTTGASPIVDGIYIGGTSSFNNIGDLRKKGITHVLQLCFEGADWPEDFTVCHHPVDDGVFLRAEDLEHGMRFMREALANGHKVLVMCGVGISRSTAFVLAYMVQAGHDLREAIDLIRMWRPQAWPAKALWESLIVNYKLPYTLEEIENWYSLPAGSLG